MPVKIENPGPGNQRVLASDGVTVLVTLAPSQFVTMEPVTGDPPPPPPPPTGTFAPAVAAWNTAHANDKVPVSGAAFVSDGDMSGNNTLGRTIIELTIANSIRQHGYVTAFKYNVMAVNSGSWKFKIFRPNGSGGHTLVGESQSFVPPSVGTHTLVLTTPIGPCQPGDVVGSYLPAPVVGASSKIKTSTSPGAGFGYVAGDQSTMSSFTTLSGSYLDISAVMPPPFYIGCGDSIEAGHNMPEPYNRPFLDLGISGDITSEIAYHLRQLCPDLTYQNWSRGNTTWEHAVQHTPAMVAVGPRLIEFAFGANDVAQGKDWLTWIKPKAETCISACIAAGIIPVLREVLPSTAIDDAGAAAIRSLNANYASLCATTGARLLPCHDAMAEVRPSTGLLDNLNPAFNKDGWHLKNAGVVEMASIKHTFYNGQVWVP